ncbi:MAG: hypothetical protein KDB01_16325 [Planctomycetaceae bacterium]|nr:hypothetical protein [Planctomycetaceae bacterium]
MNSFQTLLIFGLSIAVALLSGAFRSHDLFAGEPPAKASTFKIETPKGVCEAFTLDATANICVCGQTNGSIKGFTNQGGSDAFVIKCDSNNRQQWVLQWGSTRNDVAVSVAADGCGGVYVTGNASDTEIGDSVGFIGRIDANGNMQWCRECTVFAKLTVCREVCVDPDGFVYVVGDSRRDSGSSVCGFVRKHAADGTPVWTQTIGNQTSAQAIFLRVATVDRNGSSYIAGDVFGGLNDEPGFGHSDGMAASYDSDGNLRFVRHWGTTGDDYVKGMSIDDDENLFVCGNSLTTDRPDRLTAEEALNRGSEIFGSDSFERELSSFVRMYDRGGTLQYELIIPDRENAYRVVADSRGSFYLGRDRTFSKHSSSDGQEIWRDTLNTGLGGIVGLALDQKAGLVVIGSAPPIRPSEWVGHGGIVVRYARE